MACILNGRRSLGVGLVLAFLAGPGVDLSGLGSQSPSDDLDVVFSGKTLRFDFFHSGSTSEEHFSPDEFRAEGDWPGSWRHLLDDSNLGKYYAEVRRVADDRVIYSRGFSSIFGEWETTGEALEGNWRTFHESIRFPEPKGPARIEISKRSADGTFQKIFSREFDPEANYVNRSASNRGEGVWEVFTNGPPDAKVDLLILGDGYRSDEVEQFQRDVRRLATVLFETEPFRSRRSDFNVRAIDVESTESGISDPRGGIWRASPLGLAFNAFDTDRYVLTFYNRQVREIAAQAPYDTLLLLFNSRKYGGGGIFNLWAACSSGSRAAPYVFVHEFGHSFGGLGDEYYSSQVAYENFTPPGVEPWEPNITALLDPARLKWKDLVEPGTPLPTSWDGEAFDRVSGAYQSRRQMLQRDRAPDSALEDLFDEVKDATRKVLEAEPYFNQVGAFEGAGYKAKGLFRPSVDCIMFSRNPREFCPVCRAALEKAIDLYSSR